MTARAAIYPTEAWRIREASFDPTLVARNETIFALGNGYLDMRGNFEEGRCTAVAGTYINGFFEETPIVYGEIAYGYAKNRQVMVNVADAKVIRLFVDGEPLDMSRGSLFSYERSLDLREGVLVRSLTWRSPGGGASNSPSAGSSPSCGGMPPRSNTPSESGWDAGLVRLESPIKADVANAAAGADPRVGSHFRKRPLSTVGVEGSGRRACIAPGNEERETGPGMHRGSRRAGRQRPSRRGGHQYRPRQRGISLQVRRSPRRIGVPHEIHGVLHVSRARERRSSRPGGGLRGPGHGCGL